MNKFLGVGMSQTSLPSLGRSVLEAIQEAQNGSLILEMRNKQSWVRLNLGISASPCGEASVPCPVTDI